MKRFMSLFLVICMLLVSVAVFAYDVDNIKVAVNGNYLTFDVPPQMINDRTMVPIRAIFEAVGATVLWDETTQTATSTKDDTTIQITINSNTMYVNNNPVPLDVPACVINDRTLVPVRAISESFGCSVDWDDTTQTVVITSNDMPIQSGYPFVDYPIITPRPTVIPKITPWPTVAPRATPIPTRMPTIDTNNSQKSDSSSDLSKRQELIEAEYDRHEKAIQDINNDYNSYKNIVNRKIDEIRNETTPSYDSEAEHNKKVSKMTSEIADLENRINTLSLDDSREAQAEKRQLEKEVAELQEDLADYQERYAAKKSIDMLNDDLANYKESCEQRKAEENELHEQNLRKIKYN